MKRPRFHICQTDKGWHVNYIAPNGEIVMTSEIYNSKASAKKAIASIKRGAVMARITE